MTLVPIYCIPPVESGREACKHEFKHLVWEDLRECSTYEERQPILRRRRSSAIFLTKTGPAFVKLRYPSIPEERILLVLQKMIDDPTNFPLMVKDVSLGQL